MTPTRKELARCIQAAESDHHGGKVMLSLELARAILARLQESEKPVSQTASYDRRKYRYETNRL